MAGNSTTNEICEERERKYEMICGIMLAIFAAMLAITNLASGHFEGDQMVAVNEKASAYSWYTSKSIKQTLLEGQMELLQSLLDSGAINAENTDAITGHISNFETKVEKYSSEKDEILRGSSVVGEENWVQDVEGVLGVVTGAQEWEAIANAYDAVGNIFDLATLFLELCLVLGAISLILSVERIRNTFFFGMNLTGAIGFVVSIWGIYAGMGV